MYSLYKEKVLRYDSMSDEDIVDAVRVGHPMALDFLLYKYKNLVRSKSRTYFIMGADREDIIQEGMIGLFKAIRDYDRERLASFRTFAEICITRQMITAIKSAARQKHIPLNSYISLNKPLLGEGVDIALIDILERKNSDPLDIFIDKEEIDYIESKFGTLLTELEWEVVTRYIEGKSYQEISEEIDKDEKSIDNALQRVRKKFARHLKQ